MGYSRLEAGCCILLLVIREDESCWPIDQQSRVILTRRAWKGCDEEMRQTGIFDKIMDIVYGS